MTLPFTSRWYLEFYTGNFAGTLASDLTIGSAGKDGRVSAAARADYAEAAAVAMIGDGPENVVYGLGGDRAFSYPEFAAALSGCVSKINSRMLVDCLHEQRRALVGHVRRSA